MIINFVVFHQLRHELREMFIDPEMGRRPAQCPPLHYVALMLAIAFILCLLVACETPMRS